MGNYLMPAIIVVILGLCGGAIYGSMKEQERWEQFAATHDCKVIGHKKSQAIMGTGISSSGNVVTTTQTIPAQTGYLCNDGVTYWR